MEALRRRLEPRQVGRDRGRELAYRRAHARLVPDVAAPVWILTHKDLRTTTRVRVLREFLTDAIVANRHVFEGR